MAKTTRARDITLVVVAVGVIVLSVLVTLYLNGSIFSNGSRDGDSGTYKNVTLTDAQVECEQYARQELGRRLKALSVDNHSTRYDELERRYKVFMEAELYDSDARQGPTKTFHVYCFSRGDQARVAQFKMVEDKEYQPSAIRKREGGIFGWQ